MKSGTVFPLLRLFFFVGSAIIFLLNVSCKEEQVETEPEEPVERETYEVSREEFESWGVRVGELRQRRFLKAIEAEGIFDVPPQEKASVSPYFSGYVKRLDLSPGQKVNRGQLLFALENPEFLRLQQDFLEARARHKYLEREYNQLQRNSVRVSESEISKAESEYLRVLARLESMGKQLRLVGLTPDSLTAENIQSTLMVLAPVSGFISEVNIEIGAYVEATAVAVKIIDPKNLHLKIPIAEKDLPKIEKGQKIRFHLFNDPENLYEAEVELVSRGVNEETRTIPVKARIIQESEKQLFNFGMKVKTQIIIATDYALALPKEAIVEKDGTYYVLVLENSGEETLVFRRREVVPGPSEEGFVAITNTSDFSAGTEFLLRGASRLLNDQ